MQARGIFLTVLSAVLYGLNPLFSKTINVGGCNSLTQTFARLAAGIVIFFILLVCSGSGSVREKLRLSRQELKDILICCIGYGLIGPLLFASYNYLASGLATTLHFVYPVLVVVACIAFRYERANRRKLVCCALCFAGILCFYTPGGDVSAYGVFLALASGVAWAYYIVHLNSSGLVTMAPFKLAFWLCVFSAVLVGGITLAKDNTLRFAFQTDAQGSLVCFSEEGYVKQTALSDFLLQNRNGKGSRCFSWQKDASNGTHLVAAFYLRAASTFEAWTELDLPYHLPSSQISFEERGGFGQKRIPNLLGDPITQVIEL